MVLILGARGTPSRRHTANHRKRRGNRLFERWSSCIRSYLLNYYQLLNFLVYSLFLLFISDFSSISSIIDSFIRSFIHLILLLNVTSHLRIESVFVGGDREYVTVKKSLHRLLTYYRSKFQYRSLVGVIDGVFTKYTGAVTMAYPSYLLACLSAN